MSSIILSGVILAFGLILPLGIQNIFIFQQGAHQKSFLHALPAVLTASVCDTILISLSVGGISVLVLAHPVIETAISAAGVIFLLYMGVSIWKSQPVRQQTGERSDIKRQVIFTASVSLLNPHAILDTAGVIGSSSLQYEDFDRLIFACSCIAVSWIWFFSLALAGRSFHKLDESGRVMEILNKCSAVLVWGIAVSIFIRLIG
ncbi:LysE/ArgO family amino acid transporter [Peribacillus sp. SCS-26]|uniref:LysE/ArgO family amino acid transporter n=1 Tax=Paraperibacillus marinus TaxID=3115295 RepID=UPI003905EAC1